MADTPKAERCTVNCFEPAYGQCTLPEGHIECHHFEGHLPLTSEPPARVWISGECDGDPNFYTEGEQPEIGIEYLAAAPLRAILAEMPKDQRDIGYQVVDNDIWRRLCEIINGK